MNKHHCEAAKAGVLLSLKNVSIASDDTEQRRIFHKENYQLACHYSSLKFIRLLRVVFSSEVMTTPSNRMKFRLTITGTLCKLE